MCHDSFDFFISEVFNRNIGGSLPAQKPTNQTRIGLTALLKGRQGIAGLHYTRDLWPRLEHYALPIEAIKNSDEGAGCVTGYHDSLNFVSAHDNAVETFLWFKGLALLEPNSASTIPRDKLNPLDRFACPVRRAAYGGDSSLGHEWLASLDTDKLKR
jgi:hypothetical protein